MAACGCRHAFELNKLRRASSLPPCRALVSGLHDSALFPPSPGGRSIVRIRLQMVGQQVRSRFTPATRVPI